MDAVIDTNPLVYDYVEGSEFHKEARRALDELDNWLMPTVALEEFVFVMKKAGLEDARISMKIGELLEDRHIQLAAPLPADVKNAVSLLGSEKASFFRFNDKLILSIASRRRLPLLTFDKELKAQAKRIGVPVLP